MQISRTLAVILLIVSVSFFCFITACNNTKISKSVDGTLHFYKNKKPIKPNELSIQYFGIGSTLINFNGNSVFTDPCLSNPSLSNVVFGKIATDTALIKLLNPQLQNVAFTLIGHAHYDHLLDLPYLATQILPKESKIIGCQSALNLITSANIPQKYVATNKIKGNIKETGIWTFNEAENVRTMAFEADHPPQIAGFIKLGMGKVKEPLPVIPQKASKWKEGETNTYIIDFLDEEKQAVEKRVFIQTSSGRFPKGMIPKEILDEKNIDVAIIPADLDRTFQAVDYLKAEKYVVVHWENFFKSKLLKAKPFSKGRMNEIRNKIDEMGLEEKVVVPLPGEFMVF